MDESEKFIKEVKAIIDERRNKILDWAIDLMNYTEQEKQVFRDSLAVEQGPVKTEVAGANPAPGANILYINPKVGEDRT